MNSTDDVCIDNCGLNKCNDNFICKVMGVNQRRTGSDAANDVCITGQCPGTQCQNNDRVCIPLSSTQKNIFCQ